LKKIPYEMLAVEDNKLFTSLTAKWPKDKSYVEFYKEYIKMLELLCKACDWTLQEYMNEELLRIDSNWMEVKPITNKKMN
jgi:hypothetical protein